jgi:hypothetical protein
MTDPSVEFTQISFPSDSLTVAALRKSYPRSFDLPRVGGSDRTYGRGSLDDTLGNVIDNERLIASLAFKKAIGLSPTEAETEEPRETLVEFLTHDYVTLGVAAGEHHAEQLIRDIEAQATAQARSHPGHH